MISISGFNGFKQISSLHSFVQNVSENIVTSSVKEFQIIFLQDFMWRNIVISWSYIIIHSEDILWIFGFSDPKDGLVQSFKAPDGCKLLQISCNRQQVVCLTTNGGCWQLSPGTGQWKDLSSILWTQVPDNKSQEAVVRVCCGETLTAILTNAGEVFNFPNKLSLHGVKIVDVACGRSHILMLSDKGEVYSVGEGSRGQLGHGELEWLEEPGLVEGLAGLKVVAVACGGWHSCAITADGDLYSWGWNMCGQLGVGAKGNAKISVQAVPQVVDWPNDDDVQVIKVACGARHTVALLDDGSVWGCGWNKYGQLALPGDESLNQMTKLLVPSSGGNVQTIVCGPWNTCLVHEHDLGSTIK